MNQKGHRRLWSWYWSKLLLWKKRCIHDIISALL